ncbi:MAG: response regulator [Burkholderiales bacterium]|nr:MAG: response regulator [Burkholderiales bacterium]
MSAKARILIADDSRIVRATIAQHIRDRFDVREASDGEAAWQAMLLDSSIRIVITDLTMPKIDGFELITRARASKIQRIREMPLIVLSGADEQAECERAAALGATDFVLKGVNAAELISRLEVLIKLSSTREALAESRAVLQTSRTVDPDTDLLVPSFFDRQVDKLISYSRRNMTDVAVICIRVELTMPDSEVWEGEIEQRARLVARSLAAAIRMEDLATRSDRHEFCVATQSDGVAGVLHFAARLRKVLENVDAAGGGVEVWTCIGVASLSEDMRLSAEQLRQISQKRAQQAQTGRSRRIVLGAADAGGGNGQSRADEGSMDVNLALTLIRSGRAAEVVPHLPRLVHQLRPLMALVRQQKELELSKKETVVHGSLQGVPRPLDQRP